MAGPWKLQEKEREQSCIGKFKPNVDKKRVRINFTIRTQISEKCYNKI